MCDLTPFGLYCILNWSFTVIFAVLLAYCCHPRHGACQNVKVYPSTKFEVYSFTPSKFRDGIPKFRNFAPSICLALLILAVCHWFCWLIKLSIDWLIDCCYSLLSSRPTIMALSLTWPDSCCPVVQHLLPTWLSPGWFVAQLVCHPDDRTPTRKLGT